jgi:hypothetical protein
MGHPLMNRGIYLDNDLISWLILVEQLAQLHFAAFSRFFRQETAGSGTKTF